YSLFQIWLFSSLFFSSEYSGLVYYTDHLADRLLICYKSHPHISFAAFSESAARCHDHPCLLHQFHTEICRRLISGRNLCPHEHSSLAVRHVPANLPKSAA